MLNQFKNLSCYEEFEIQCALTGISKVDVLNEIGRRINNYYLFVSEDGIFNWFDLNGNHVEYPGVLKTLKEEHIPQAITKCIIPDSVIYIDKYAFVYCESLTSINIPDSVISIGDKAFYYCESLKEITIPNSVIRIGYYAFSWCTSLQTITIPDNVISIGNEAFLCCKSLKSIIIPNSVTYIGDWAFSHCESLKEIIFKGKTLEEVKQMKNYPFGIKDESIIKFG